MIGGLGGGTGMHEAGGRASLHSLRGSVEDGSSSPIARPGELDGRGSDLCMCTGAQARGGMALALRVLRRGQSRM